MPKQSKDHNGRYKCDQCRRMLSSKQTLRKHRRFHCRAIIETNFICPHCDMVFYAENQLDVHINHMCDQNPACQIIACPSCDKRFSNSGNRSKHIKYHCINQTDREHHLCTECGAILASLANLRRHVRDNCPMIETNVKLLFYCPHCDLSGTSVAIRKHINDGCSKA